MASQHPRGGGTPPSPRLALARTPDFSMGRARLPMFERSLPLASPPGISEEQTRLLGVPAPGSNDAVDQALLAAIMGNAAEYLVTEDQGIHRNARRLGVGDRVMTVADALSTLNALHIEMPSPPPAVERVKVHELDVRDPIFDTLKEDYPEFPTWLTRVSREQRDALLVRGEHGHAAIAILKREMEGMPDLPGPLLKICTLKVAEGHSGQKYGELLLKTVFHQAHVENDAGIYLTVFDKHEQLIELIEDFGFEWRGDTTRPAEKIYAKRHGAAGDPTGLAPLDFHVRYGPPALTVDSAQVFLVPIEPRWHRVLFPDAEPADDALLPAIAGLAVKPFGNAIRKAYLCNSPSRLLSPGDILLFYRSQDERAIWVVGVCEQVLVSSEAAHVAAIVGRRTVYSYDDINDLTRKGEVLAILFRQDRILRDAPIPLVELMASRALRGAPQSITRAREEGTTWLKKRLVG